MERKDLLLGLLSLALFYVILQSSASGIVKFLSSAAMFSLLTEYYRKKYNLQTFFVFLLYRTKKGLQLMSKLARKHSGLLKAMSDVAVAFSFGFASLWIMNWLNLRDRILSLLTAYVLMVLVYTVIFPLSASYFFSFGELSLTSQQPSSTLFDAVLPVIAFLGGVVSAVSALTFKGALFVLSQLYDKFIVGVAVEVQQHATLILPGITISLFEGILALALVLVVHEGAHGALSVIGRVPLKSTGLVFFGSLPVGAFVEPDEEKLFSRPTEVRARTLSAGVGANIFTALVVSVLYLFFLVLTANAAVEGCYVVSGTLPKGTVITAINGVQGCYLSIPADSVVELTTLKGGSLTLVSDEEGKIGVSAFPIGSASTIRVYSNPILNFLYHLLGLALALNIVVAIVNLIPIPLFDGDHLLRTAIGDNSLYNIIKYSLLGAFLLLLLPGILP